MYCKKPFTEIEIYNDGKVFICCPSFTNDFYIGNVFEVDSFDEIWYSERAITFRKKILNNDYSLCNLEICQKEELLPDELNSDILSIKPPYPQKVRFSFDTTCNLKCIFCRNQNNKFLNRDKFENIIDKILIPIVKKAKILTINTIGEISVSPFSINLLKKVIENTTEDLKIEINTNGLYFNEDFINKNKLNNRLCNVVVSIHATSKKTYNKIVKNSDFDKVIQNIKFLSEMKKQGKLKDLACVFVCFSYNYKELISFIDFCKSLEIYPLIWSYMPMQVTKNNIKDQKFMIWKKEHIEYNKFAKIIKYLKQKYIRNVDYRISEDLYNVEPISIAEHIWHIIVYKLKNIKLPNKMR